MKYYAILGNKDYIRYIQFKKWYGYKEAKINKNYHIVFYNFPDDRTINNFKNLLPYNYVDENGIYHIKQWLKPIDDYLKQGSISEETFIELERNILNEKKG